MVESSSLSHEASDNSQSRPTVFSKHTENDAALSTTSVSDAKKVPSSMRWISRVAIYFGFPCFMGCTGLYLAYLEGRRNPERKMRFDNDFVYPFLLALGLCIVIGIQTGGFTQKKVTPLVAWPKVKRVKKINQEDTAATEEVQDKKNN